MSEAIVARDLFRVHSTPEGDAAALQGLTLTVPERQLLAVVGPSGSGKTTLLRILAGLDRPSAGSVRVFGQDVAKLKRRALAAYRSRNVGYLDQHYGAALDPRLDARTLVALRLRLAGASAREAERGARELLERVGLNGRSAAHPSELSGGEQQRVAVCAALAHHPRLLLADEPTGELDRENANAIFALIRELAADYGTTVLVVTHDPAAARFADRAVRIRDGRVSEELHAAGADRIVVGRGGWLRLPEELLREAGIREHAEAELAGGDLRIRPVGPDFVAQSHNVAERSLEIPPGVAAEARDLTKVYGEGDTARVVLDGFDARFERGSLYAVTGPSGSGKTTLLNLLAGLERPTSGSAVVDGRELTMLDRSGRAAVRRDAVGYVAQQPTLFPFLSARENVELALTLRGRHDESALEILTDVGLAERAEQRVERLSAGERLRAAIARALVVEPALLLADEPTSRLDEANAAAIAELLGRLAREVGAAVVCASHDPVVLDRSDEQISLA
jgi:ABC-type lipoprotein export system ATPase subunit